MLAPEEATELEDLKMGGYLAVLGEDEKLSKSVLLLSISSAHKSPKQ